MNIPNLPTDNLYKFIALTGVVLFLTFLIYPSFRAIELNEKIYLIDAESRKLDIESSNLEIKRNEVGNVQIITCIHFKTINVCKRAT